MKFMYLKECVGAHPFMLEEDRKGSACHLQRARRDIGRQTNVS